MGDLSFIHAALMIQNLVYFSNPKFMVECKHLDGIRKLFFKEIGSNKSIEKIFRKNVYKNQYQSNPYRRYNRFSDEFSHSSFSHYNYRFSDDFFDSIFSHLANKNHEFIEYLLICPEFLQVFYIILLYFYGFKKKNCLFSFINFINLGCILSNKRTHIHDHYF